MEIPVKPFALSDSKYCVAIVCPFCHKIHWHGYNSGDYEGPRVPHCEIGRNSGNCYTIEKVKNLPMLIRER